MIKDVGKYTDASSGIVRGWNRHRLGSTRQYLPKFNSVDAATSSENTLCTSHALCLMNILWATSFLQTWRKYLCKARTIASYVVYQLFAQYFVVTLVNWQETITMDYILVTRWIQLSLSYKKRKMSLIAVFLPWSSNKGTRNSSTIGAKRDGYLC